MTFEIKFRPNDIVVPIAKELLPEDWQQCDKFVILASEYYADAWDDDEGLREVHYIFPATYQRPTHHRKIFGNVALEHIGVRFTAYELYRWTP
jgi:hypothetical protein